ncbi:hypothetical protein F5Y18DRAFT_436100 [Xylariaceae sp. FL1019]|nr:hypothetical protein F5Y18DRAFT_436100 [Xylariaceae sp. FL1019]
MQDNKKSEPNGRKKTDGGRISPSLNPRSTNPNFLASVNNFQQNGSGSRLSALQQYAWEAYQSSRSPGPTAARAPIGPYHVPNRHVSNSELPRLQSQPHRQHQPPPPPQGSRVSLPYRNLPYPDPSTGDYVFPRNEHLQAFETPVAVQQQPQQHPRQPGPQLQLDAGINEIDTEIGGLVTRLFYSASQDILGEKLVDYQNYYHWLINQRHQRSQELVDQQVQSQLQLVSQQPQQQQLQHQEQWLLEQQPQPQLPAPPPSLATSAGHSYYRPPDQRLPQFRLAPAPAQYPTLAPTQYYPQSPLPQYHQQALGIQQQPPSAPDPRGYQDPTACHYTCGQDHPHQRHFASIQSQPQQHNKSAQGKNSGGRGKKSDQGEKKNNQADENPDGALVEAQKAAKKPTNGRTPLPTLESRRPLQNQNPTLVHAFSALSGDSATGDQDMPPVATRGLRSNRSVIDLSKEEGCESPTSGIDPAIPALTMPTNTRRQSAGGANPAASSTAQPERKRRASPASPPAGRARKTRRTDDDSPFDDKDDSAYENIDLTNATEVPEEVRAPIIDKRSKLAHFQCAICLDYATDMATTHCGHLFCSECLHSSLNAENNPRRRCPVCRQVVEIQGRRANNSKSFFHVELKLSVATKKDKGKQPATH